MLEEQAILLVEDDENDLELLRQAFCKAGLEKVLKAARNGDEAIEYLSGRGAYSDRTRFPLPFLVLLDLKMPGTDGFEVLQWARSQPQLKRLLIVVLTSSELQADVDRAYELGANSYLVKPVGFQEMVALIKRFEVYWTELNRKPTAPTSARTANPEASLA
jgi:CheY-like chemotaxis protein